MKKYDIVGAENLIIDLLMKIDSIPESDNQADLFDILWQPGGNASNAVVTASLLGSRCSMIGLAGTDQYGDYALKDLAMYGVDISNCKRANGNTAISVCMSETKNKKRSFLGKKACLGEVHLSNEDMEMVKDAECIHFSHADCMLKEPLLKYAYKNGIMTSFDGGFYRESDEAMYQYFDIMIISKEYFYDCMKNHMRSESIDFENLRWLQSKGPSIVMVTLGADGSIGINGDEELRVQGNKGIPVTDTIGAGDAFHGAFLHKYIQTKNFKESVNFATTVSYLACFGLGARTSLPTMDDVEEYLNSGKINFEQIQRRFNYYKKVIDFTVD